MLIPDNDHDDDDDDDDDDDNNDLVLGGQTLDQRVRTMTLPVIRNGLSLKTSPFSSSFTFYHRHHNHC